VVGGVLATLWTAPVRGQQDPQRPTFRSAVELVSVAAVVRDRYGRFVRDLSADDFIVVDRGERRRIVNFTAGSSAAVTLALLVDESGSMRVGSSAAIAKKVVGQFLDVIAASGQAHDEVALFGFDTRMRELQPFTSNLEAVRATLGELEPFGSTSIYDAIAESARIVATRGWVRRALIVVTDGMDNRSRLRLEEVSGIASAIDVPVYVLEVPAALPESGSPTTTAATLADLARWTGGEHVAVGGADLDIKVAAARIVAGVRYQYLLAFESSPTPGWRPLQIFTRDEHFSVQARAAYMAGTEKPEALGPPPLSGGHRNQHR
jgi:Ca-activated chloride channel family protein